jgi:hypothetical protein
VAESSDSRRAARSLAWSQLTAVSDESGFGQSNGAFEYCKADSECFV